MLQTLLDLAPETRDWRKKPVFTVWARRHQTAADAFPKSVRSGRAGLSLGISAARTPPRMRPADHHECLPNGWEPRLRVLTAWMLPTSICLAKKGGELQHTANQTRSIAPKD